MTAPEGSGYRFFKDSVNLDEDPPRVTGVLERQLVFDPVQVTDAGTYTCTYDNGSKAIVTTQPCPLTVYEAGQLPVVSPVGFRNAEYYDHAMDGKDDLKKRTREFALRVIRLCESLPSGRTADVIGKQLLRCGTSVGANYRAACRARSSADFIAKLGIVEEECNECVYWMELLIDSGLTERRLLEPLMKEADEILSIMIASIKTARKRA